MQSITATNKNTKIGNKISTAPPPIASTIFFTQKPNERTIIEVAIVEAMVRTKSLLQDVMICLKRFVCDLFWICEIFSCIKKQV